MNLDELEQQIRMHRRGRRREVTVVATVAAVLLGVVAGLVWLIL